MNQFAKIFTVADDQQMLVRKALDDDGNYLIEVTASFPPSYLTVSFGFSEESKMQAEYEKIDQTHANTLYHDMLKMFDSP